jgi:cupin 2 domain-containing protein
MKKQNIFNNTDIDLKNEVFEELLKTPGIRIERIISKGHTQNEWYDQNENEWVMVLEGEGKLEFESGEIVELKKGDYINIKKHIKHKVIYTPENKKTIWLAIFYE